MHRRRDGLSWRCTVRPQEEQRQPRVWAQIQTRADVRWDLGGALSWFPPASQTKQTTLSVRMGEQRPGRGGGVGRGMPAACLCGARAHVGSLVTSVDREWTSWSWVSAAEGLASLR